MTNIISISSTINPYQLSHFVMMTKNKTNKKNNLKANDNEDNDDNQSYCESGSLPMLQWVK